MAVFDCSMCHARYDVEDELAGQAIRCRECGEWGRVPRRPTAVSSPPPPPRAPARPQPARTVKREPWCFDFAEGYAFVTLALAAVAAALLLVVAVVAGGKDAWAGLLVAAGGVVVFMSGCFACALLFVLVDVGRSLRMSRPKRRKARRGAG
jgi:DNA-directed RNA polymerase subunit RPC12/RpoP